MIICIFARKNKKHMGLFDDLNENFHYTRKFTYKDVVRMLEDIFAEEKQKDTENVSSRNQEVNQ